MMKISDEKLRGLGENHHLMFKKQEKAPQISFSGKSKTVLQQKMGSAQIQGKQKSNLQQQSTSRDTSYRATNSLTQSLQDADE